MFVVLYEGASLCNSQNSAYRLSRIYAHSIGCSGAFSFAVFGIHKRAYSLFADFVATLILIIIYLSSVTNLSLCILFGLYSLVDISVNM